MKVAALYVDSRGPYLSMANVEAWCGLQSTSSLFQHNSARDAKKYDGPHPVVAHPPCGPWGKLAHMCKYQDTDCAPIAVGQTQKWGGVMEHPVGSRLWAHCGLPAVGEGCDQHGGFTISVRQCDWGHSCAKPTLLYVVGIGLADVPGQPPAREPIAAVTNSGRWTGQSDARPFMANRRRASSREVMLTPPSFALWLVSIARECRI